MDIKDLRPEVLGFALLMEAKLRLNDHKRHWSKCADDYLFGRLKDEVEELHIALTFHHRVIEECVDVANFAMMIADNEARKE